MATKKTKGTIIKEGILNNGSGDNRVIIQSKNGVLSMPRNTNAYVKRKRKV